MKFFTRRFTWILLLCVGAGPLMGRAFNRSEGTIVLKNEAVELGFDSSTGRLVRMVDLVHSQSFIDSAAVHSLPWEIRFHRLPSISLRPGRLTPERFTGTKKGEHILLLQWEAFKGYDTLVVRATITLDATEPFSYWSLEVEGMPCHRMAEVAFPVIGGLFDQGNEKLVVPTWMGSLIHDPRKELFGRFKRRVWNYPGSLSSQVIALYSPGKSGFYASCNDSLSYAKNFSIEHDTTKMLTYKMIHIPPFDSLRTSFALPGQAVIGTFRGDWLTVAEIYQQWALQQRWARESRLKRGLTPAWLDSTALWVWNRGRSEEVLTPAVGLRERLGLPVSVYWHWWHHCAYDDNFPEYLPPREGREPFIRAVTAAEEAGVNAIVYMNALQWGEAAEGYRSGRVKPYTLKDVHGEVNSLVYNIFSGNALINMCVGTRFWKDHYASLCDSVVNTYGASGVYMDQTCLSRVCFDAGHDHPPGGGNYWVEHSGAMIRQIRAADYGGRQPIFTGEGSAENWLPHLDGFLTLQASRERYAGVDQTETIPFFQAVYHPYAITFGSYASLVSPPYDELWPEAFAPESAGELLDTRFNRQFLMEQARSFVWGMQPAIANYREFLASERPVELNYLLEMARLRHGALKYLLHGRFMRTPAMAIPEEEIDISRLSIYVGRKGSNVTAYKKRVPMLCAGTWQAGDGEVGMALASIGDRPLPVHFTMNAGDYDLPPEGRIYLRTVGERQPIGSYRGGVIEVEVTLPPLGLCIVEITP